jgi:hypothetical protein
VVKFLTDEWVDALTHAAQQHPNATPSTLIVEYRVRDGDGEPFVYHLRFVGPHIEVRKGPAAAAVVAFTTNRETACAIARGELSAPAAFMAGRLQLSGDTAALLRNSHVLVAVDDVFAGVREHTEY